MKSGLRIREVGKTYEGKKRQHGEKATESDERDQITITDVVHQGTTAGAMSGEAIQP
jgi:chorismate synthase